MKFRALQVGAILSLITLCHSPAAVLYVDINGSNPTPPYSSWSTASTDIQSAIDAANDGDQILVTNGVYQTGGRVVYGALTNRVVINKAVTVQSVNGPALTTIQGYQLPGPTNGDSAVRGVYLTNGAVLVGFTITGGATRSAGDWYKEDSGGGIWCETNAVISNCVVTANFCTANGAGIYGGTVADCIVTFNSTTDPYGEGGGTAASAVSNCVLIGNSSCYGGGAASGDSYSILIGCTLGQNSSPRQGSSGLGYGGAAWGVTLINCTVTNNYAYYGGGLSSECVALNCLISGNYGTNGAGGAESSVLTNCTLSKNLVPAGETGGGESCTFVNCAIVANSGQGAVYSTLYNCTVTGNQGLGAGSSTLNNCLDYYNQGGNDSGNSDVFNYCCTTPLPTNGSNDITAEPKLTDSIHLSAASPCRGAGSGAFATGVDIDGEPWLNPPSVGADEYYTGGTTGALSVAVEANYTNVAVGFTVALTAHILGHASENYWIFGDGTSQTNALGVSHLWTNGGDYTVVVHAINDDNPTGVSASVIVHVPAQSLFYVAATNANPLPPYLSWNAAATNIQDAVDAACTGGAVLVADGSYGAGGDTNSRVVVNRPMTISSVNGPVSTLIDGSNAVRCVYLCNGSALSGFALTNGAAVGYQSGGGIFCDSTNVPISNCLFINNSAYIGGGVSGGLLNSCTFIGNSSHIGGSPANYDGGGGALSSVLNNCTLIQNTSTGGGGGARSCVLNGCSLIQNTSSYYGGAAYTCTLNNCTVVSNSATYGGGGVMASTLFNSIVYYSGDNCYGSSLTNCCTWPAAGGTGNITNDPSFVNPSGEDFHLQTNSPCINAGKNSYVSSTTDLDGNPRIVGGTVDIGAYEYQAPTSVISYAWLEQYGLPIDGSADFVDTDGTGMNNWQKWIAGLNPFDRNSVFLMLSPATTNSPGVTVSWDSVNTRTYYLQRASNLAGQPAFTTIQSNVVGQAGITSYTDTSATNGGPYFYRVGVQ